MPRMPRSQLPSPAWYHVISRGVEQRTIVLDGRDRESWFKLLVDVTKQCRWKVHAWNLLDNHFHLLVETTQPELSRGMQRLNAVHAIRFNRRYARSGHLFQGRFESRVLEGDEHLATVIEYVYENSTRVGLGGWPWRGSGDHPRDYASARAGRGAEAERAADRRDRAPERRRCDPPRRGARPLQRARGALEPARALRGAAGAARGRPCRGGVRRLDGARRSHRGPHEAREPPLSHDVRPGPAPLGARDGRRGTRGEAELAHVDRWGYLDNLQARVGAA